MTPIRDRNPNPEPGQTECQRLAARAYLLVVAKNFLIYWYNLPAASDSWQGGPTTRRSASRSTPPRQHALAFASAPIASRSATSAAATAPGSTGHRFGSAALAAGDVVQVGGVAMILQLGPSGSAATHTRCGGRIGAGGNRLQLSESGRCCWRTRRCCSSTICCAASRPVRYRCW